MLNRSLKERFLDKVNIPQDKTDCWLWQGAKFVSGYGLMRIAGKTVYAHRLAYTIFIGEIPKGKLILHSCDTPLCCNPAHLRLGTDRDNALDRDSRNRNSIAKGENNGMHKLKEKDIPKIRRMIACGYSQRYIGKVFSVSCSTINWLKLGKTWNHVK